MSRVYVCLALVAAALPATYAFLPIPALSQISGRSAEVSGVSSLSMMRHRCKTPQLSLPADQRKALMRSLTTEVIRHGRITTTLARAKAIRGAVMRPQKRDKLWNNRISVHAVFDAVVYRKLVKQKHTYQSDKISLPHFAVAQAS
jgi:large subunit ribosomal protein L17